MWEFNVLAVFATWAVIFAVKMNMIHSFLLVRCFVLTLVLGFPHRISTPPQIAATTTERKQSSGECKDVEEVGFIIEPDAGGRDNIPFVPELQLIQPMTGHYEAMSPPSWCHYSRLLYWWCATGRDQFPGYFPESYLPVENSHNMNASECFFMSGVWWWL